MCVCEKLESMHTSRTRPVKRFLILIGIWKKWYILLIKIQWSYQHDFFKFRVTFNLMCNLITDFHWQASQSNCLIEELTKMASDWKPKFCSDFSCTPKETNFILWFFCTHENVCHLFFPEVKLITIRYWILITIIMIGTKSV